MKKILLSTGLILSLAACGQIATAPAPSDQDTAHYQQVGALGVATQLHKTVVVVHDHISTATFSWSATGQTGGTVKLGGVSEYVLRVGSADGVQVQDVTGRQ